MTATATTTGLPCFKTEATDKHGRQQKGLTVAEEKGVREGRGHLVAQRLLIPAFYMGIIRILMRALCFVFWIDFYLQKCCNGQRHIPFIDEVF